MTKSERQQSLINARRAVEWLEMHIVSVGIGVEPIDVTVGQIAQVWLRELVAQFGRLDANASRPRAGRPRIETDNPKTLAQRRWRDKSN